MSKTRLIEYSEKHYAEEFEIGKFILVGYPHDTPKGVVPQKPTVHKFLDWINELALKGLIYHSQFDGDYIFRVDGAVLEQLKTELEFTSNSTHEYVGDNRTGSMYKTNTTLLMYLDGDRISEVSLP